MFRRFYNSLFALLLILSAPSPLLARQKFDGVEVEKVALEELKTANTPGAAIAIVSGDQVIFAKGFGVSNVETGAPVTPDMVFRIGSVNKMFTAALLVTLAEEGKPRLDEPIGAYIKGLDLSFSQLTAHQMMSHTAGLRNEEAGAIQYGTHDEPSRSTSILSWRKDRFFAEPGRVFSYSNDGYVLAGTLIEVVGGKPYSAQMTDRLFRPLGMGRTTFYPTMAMTYPLSQGHIAFGKAKPAVVRPFADNAVYWPAGFMFSTALDLARFTIAFMNGGRIEGRQVLSPSVIAKLSTPYVDIPGLENTKYGYGLMLHNYRGVEVVEHEGGVAGFGALIRMVPERRFAIIVLTNKFGGSLSKTADKAMELLLPLKAADEKAKEPLPMSEAEMDKYAGVYAYSPVSHPPQKVELLVKAGKLFIKIGALEAPLDKVGDWSFAAKGEFPFPRFSLVPGSDGKAEFLHLAVVAFKRIPAGK